MRLLNIYTLELRYFNEDEIPPYAIASHRWIGDEITYQQFLARSRNSSSTAPLGLRKVLSYCEFVKGWSDLGKWDIKWLWIDTICINKESDAELSEAINSMFSYYKNAEVCIAYLHDVYTFSERPLAVFEAFESSAWFTRGWTLQELLAPRMVIFLNQDWDVIGHKAPSIPPKSLPAYGSKKYQLTWNDIRIPLNVWIAKITGVPEDVLADFARSTSLSVDVRMAWTRNRETKRPEDRAYCLLGIFNIWMPVIYGEGDNAMRRLRREFRTILTPVQSIPTVVEPSNVREHGDNVRLGTSGYASDADVSELEDYFGDDSGNACDKTRSQAGRTERKARTLESRFQGNQQQDQNIASGSNESSCSRSEHPKSGSNARPQSSSQANRRNISPFASESTASLSSSERPSPKPRKGVPSGATSSTSMSDNPQSADNNTFQGKVFAAEVKEIPQSPRTRRSEDIKRPIGNAFELDQDRLAPPRNSYGHDRPSATDKGHVNPKRRPRAASDASGASRSSTQVSSTDMIKNMFWHGRSGYVSEQEYRSTHARRRDKS